MSYDQRRSFQASFAEALQRHQAGDLVEAEALYRAVLADYPEHADSLHLLGLVARQTGRAELAVELIRKAIAIDAGAAPYYSSLGSAFADLKRHELAEACYRRATDLQPDFLEAQFNLAQSLREQGQHDAAIEGFRRALVLGPQMADIHQALGDVLRDRGRLDEAVECFRAVSTLRPDDPDACAALAIALRGQGRPDEAVDWFRRAVAARPDLADGHNNLGIVLREQGRLDEAAACCRRAIAVQPGLAAAHSNLGNVLRDQGRLSEAIDSFRRALTLSPDFLDAISNLGNALREQGRLDEAMICGLRAVEINPDTPEALTSLGNTLKDQRRFDQAENCFRRAIALRPEDPQPHANLTNLLREAGRLDDAVASGRVAVAVRPDLAEAHFNLALALLKRGDLAEGWAEYEWRWQMRQAAHGRRLAQPQWRGEAAAGRTLLIHAEQGFGDTLQFCRYAPLAAALGLRVVLEVPRPLVRLLGRLPGVAQIVASGEPLPAFDLHCPMMSLPLAFGTDLSTIPGAAPYLSADPAQVAAWQARLGAGGPRVGLVWAGNPRRHSPALEAMDRRRSLDPDFLAMIALPGLQLVSLQKDGPPAPPGVVLTDFMAEVDDFADTAALIATLDLVVSVDTAVAHLAAALDKPVWLLDRHDSCWRWLSGRRDSPWYPTLRLYRQPHPGDWGAVMTEVAADLGRLATPA